MACDEMEGDGSQGWGYDSEGGRVEEVVSIQGISNAAERLLQQARPNMVKLAFRAAMTKNLENPTGWPNTITFHCIYYGKSKDVEGRRQRSKQSLA
jgi:hypothetical protein